MAYYKQGQFNTVIRIADNTSIPRDERNIDYIEFLRWQTAGGVIDPYVPPNPPAVVTSQDLMAQFTSDDATKIQAAVSANPQFWLLWSALQTQSDPMVVTNARFMAGWSALVSVLGQSRMDAIASALGVTIPKA